MHPYQIRDNDAATHHHPVDDIEPLPDTRGDLAEALVRVVIWMHSSKEAVNIGARGMVLATALNLQLENVSSYADIARASGLSREAIRLMAKELESKFGLRSSNSRSNETRRRCKVAREKVVNRETAPK